MKKLLNTYYFKILTFLIIIFLLDYIVGNTLQHFYFTQESGYQYRITYALEKTTADVLVFGSSRALHHYHPAAFRDDLKYSFYNCGKDGNYIFYHYAILKSVLKRYKPKIIIYDLMPGEFENNSGSYDYIASLLPYYKTHPELKPIIELKSKYEKYKLLSNIYPYNSSLFSIISGNMEINKHNKEDDDGYTALTGEPILGIEETQDPEEYEMDTIKFQYFENFIQECQNNDITLYFVSSPHFLRFNSMDSSIKKGIEIINKYGIKYFSYLQDERFLGNAVYFKDNSHLNDSGAILFSKLLVEDIKKEQNKNLNTSQKEGDISNDSAFINLDLRKISHNKEP